MMLQQFTASLSAPAPPADLPPLLVALWWEANGDWNRAHEIAQSVGDREQGSIREAAWVHAYLHRKEGDSGNAAYWYRRSGQPVSRATFEEEWGQIAQALLDQGKPGATSA
jgi:hypothetical protein